MRSVSLPNKKAAGLAAAFGFFHGLFFGIGLELEVDVPADQLHVGHPSAQIGQRESELLGDEELDVQVGVLLEFGFKCFCDPAPPNRRSGSPASGSVGLCP